MRTPLFSLALITTLHCASLSVVAINAPLVQIPLFAPETDVQNDNLLTTAPTVEVSGLSRFAPSAWFAAQNQDTLDSATNCGVEGDILTLSRFELSPDPPQRGNPLNILLDGLLSEPVGKGAVAQVTVKLGFIQIIDHPYDLCDQVSAVDLECPIPAGPISVKKAFDIPHELPPGHYRINVNVHTADERHIGCLSADFRM
ncbi:hypothetical protein BASA81_009730 [Batrachochytrium salamandrivorans]|nr:hypothetical protein BASA62_004526 [Batrachochytrium salamandrivorans]KAH9252359.1 hypothetical protein BASA81_009730 [Batrachochytrium salamandrivorans]